MLNPISTYRIQFHAGFTFKDLASIIPYLNNLGIKTIYASPIFAASPGSMHGYDVVNPHLVNPEIGTVEELRLLSAELKKLGIGWIQDIVPNHMAFHPDNLWLMDVLEKGLHSTYADFFDINWTGDKAEPLMVPFLGSTLEEAIAKKEITLVQVAGRIKLQYFDTQWPVNDLVTSLELPVAEAVALQYYRPCHWKETDKKINYRRFFTVNNLICLNIQEQKNFELYHLFIKELLEDGVFQGLRVDHIDGLFDPETYLERLRELAGDDIYIVVEKILEADEILPEWPVEGTTGYDFLAQVNNLLTHRQAEDEFSTFYENLSGDHNSIPQQIMEKKTSILVNHMAGELTNLYNLFLSLELVTEKALAALKPEKIKEALGHLLIYCPVYRFYGTHLPLSGNDHKNLKQLLKAIAEVKGLEAAVKVLQEVLLDRPKEENDNFRTRATLFYLRLMQFSGPLMAKGVEDTLMYTYHRFIGHNEVGDAPAAFGLRKKEFHQLMADKNQLFPLAMNSTATHDTKRGEDVRARLNVLTALPGEWFNKVKEWELINAEFAAEVAVNDRYFIYQTILGSYPMPGRPLDDYTARLQAYLQKALREGKVNSDWAAPDTAYEQTVIDFIEAILKPDAPFWDSFAPFHATIADFGIFNSLAQLLVKFTSGGTPDTYQGTELWDLSLVDPDNRRPVDYAERSSLLEQLKNEVNEEGMPASLATYWEERYTGKIKLALLQRLLALRTKETELFEEGEYIKLAVKGKFAKHIFAFARNVGKKWLITIIPLHLAGIIEDQEVDWKAIDWEDTRVLIPVTTRSHWSAVGSGQGGLLKDGILKVSDVFEDFPLGLLLLEEAESLRSAGILLHITSLPSGCGIGDMGLMSLLFITFLEEARQQYWQLLPLNPISADQGYSPYSSVSAMAGNTLLIAGDLLLFSGLVEYSDYENSCVSEKGIVNFGKVEVAKAALLDIAYNKYRYGEFTEMKVAFDLFKQQEQDWLDAYALFMVYKELHNGLPWYKWEPVYRDWDTARGLKLSLEQNELLDYIKWQQYIFFEQWGRLKNSANTSGIKLYGDLPFYVGHDSADVWANRQLFSVNAEGDLIGVAGVPPDYFNADGQLWGMPVYQWDNMKADGYQWWMKRIKKNMEMYDLLRLDHFRAFADYWEVPAGDQTAVNGIWKPGPGEDFFTLLKAEFPDLPFVAEDLGEINAGVYALRDDFKLPGMKVLQFAFGDKVGQSDYIPHNFASDNFVVYTGTHDNNTTLGWFKKEASKAERKSLEKYAGYQVTGKNIVPLLTRMAYSSVAKLVILPMQDVLQLDNEARINTPGVGVGNWAWQMKQLPGPDTAEMLRELVKLYGRA